MQYYNLNYLEKSVLDGLNNNENNYMKYVAKKIKNKITDTTDGWLIPKRLLPVNRGENKNKLVEANIIKKTKVVVKISKKENLLEKDYNTSLKLQTLKIPNFAKYIGFFSCKDDFDNYELNKELPKYFCKNNGSINYFLFMQYYPIGSILNYIPTTINEIISIINQVFASLIIAFEKFGFIHGDLHPGNVLLKKTNKNIIKYGNKNIETSGLQAIIFDFDRSNFSGNFSFFLSELSAFINFYEIYLIGKNIFKKNNQMVTPFRQLKREFYKITNIEGLKSFVGN
jgi:serine/threonine protein kinase